MRRIGTHDPVVVQYVFFLGLMRTGRGTHPDSSKVKSQVSVGLSANRNLSHASASHSVSGSHRDELLSGHTQSSSLKTASVLYADISIGLNTMTFLSSANTLAAYLICLL
jgi:hypothetical protein